MSENHMMSMSEEKFKKEIKEKVKEAAFEHLLKEQKEDNKIKRHQVRRF